MILAINLWNNLEGIEWGPYLCIRFLKQRSTKRIPGTAWKNLFRKMVNLICWISNTYLSLHPLFDCRNSAKNWWYFFTFFWEIKSIKIWFVLQRECIFAVRKKIKQFFFIYSFTGIEIFRPDSLLKNWESGNIFWQIK